MGTRCTDGYELKHMYTHMGLCRRKEFPLLSVSVILLLQRCNFICNRTLQVIPRVNVQSSTDMCNALCRYCKARIYGSYDMCKFQYFSGMKYWMMCRPDNLFWWHLTNFSVKLPQASLNEPYFSIWSTEGTCSTKWRNTSWDSHFWFSSCGGKERNLRNYVGGCCEEQDGCKQKRVNNYYLIKRIKRTKKIIREFDSLMRRSILRHLGNERKHDALEVFFFKDLHFPAHFGVWFATVLVLRGNHILSSLKHL